MVSYENQDKTRSNVIRVATQKLQDLWDPRDTGGVLDVESSVLNFNRNAVSSDFRVFHIPIEAGVFQSNR